MSDGDINWFASGAGGGGAGGGGGGSYLVSHGGNGGLGVSMAIGSINTYFGCGGGGGAESYGGKGREQTTDDIKTGQGSTGISTPPGCIANGRRGYGDGGGGGYMSSTVPTKAGYGGAGNVVINEHLSTGDITTPLNDMVSEDVTVSEYGTWVPSAGVETIDVLLIGGGGAGGTITTLSSFESTYGKAYGGGGGGGGGVLLILGMPVAVTPIGRGYSTPFEFSIDKTGVSELNTSHSISGAITNNGSGETALRLVLYRKDSPFTRADGQILEGFGGLQSACERVLPGQNSYSIDGMPPGTYMLAAIPENLTPDKYDMSTVSKMSWYTSTTDGFPTTIIVEDEDITGIDIVIDFS
jgi:hypothetical protein